MSQPLRLRVVNDSEAGVAPLVRELCRHGHVPEAVQVNAADAMRDALQRPEAQEELRILSRAVSQTANSVLITDREGVIEYVNPTFERTTGYAREEVIGQTPRLLKSGHHEQKYYETLWSTLLAGEAFFAEFVNRKKSGELYHSEQSITPIRDPHGHITHFVSIGRDITKLKREQRKPRELLLHVVAAHEEERRRLATELHDRMGQKLAVLTLELKALEGPGLTPETAGAKLRGLQQLVGRLMDQVHAIAWDLRPQILDDLGLMIALRRYVAEWSERCGVPATFDSPGWEDLRLEPGMETAFYRVAQEALSNARKHAQATRVQVLLQRQPNEVLLVVEDNGQGFDLAAVENTGDARHRLGLLGIQERMALIGGTLKIESATDGGTTVFASAPTDEKDEPAAAQTAPAVKPSASARVRQRRKPKSKIKNRT